MVLRNNPFGKIDGNYRLNPDSYLDEAFRGDDLGGANLIYIAFSKPGSADADPVWQLSRLTYSGTGNVISIQYATNASGVVSNQYEFQWSNRLAYTYA